MEVQQERPPAYAHDPETLVLPSVPQHDPASRSSTAAVSLPDIKSLGLPDAHPPHSNPNGHPSQWMTLQPNSLPSVPPGAPRQSTEPFGSPMETDNIFSPESYGQRATSVTSMDDAETRMAAEALSGLRNMDFMRSPSTRSTTLQSSRPQQWQTAQQQQEEEGEEPLLQLLTTSHPWIGNTINGSLSAYNATKYYSPAFVRSSANFIERNIGSPVANTFGSVSKRTGIESGVRRYLGERRPSDVEVRPDNKRRRIKEDSPETESADIEKGLTSPSIYHYRSRTGSQASFASLPAYDDNRSPKYEEQTPLVSSPPPQLATQQRPAGPQRQTSHNWRTQLMITTSGLGVALHRNSLRSLKYCLRLIRNATDHVATIMDALKNLLSQYTSERQQTDPNVANANQPYSLSDHQQAASRAISDRIKALGDDIMSTLKSVVDAVSRYAGGALPENASALVRRQLMSVPQRWRVASESTADQSQQQDEAVRQGNRFLAFANQSLDMFAQVSLVLSSTIESAEKWLETMGRRRRGRSQSQAHAINGHQQLQLTGVPNGEKSNGYSSNQMDFTMTEKR